MELTISQVEFSESERKHYAPLFDDLTANQKKPISERELQDSTAVPFFRRMKIPDQNLAEIWELVSEGKNYLKLYNFMAFMRSASAYKQGKGVSRTNVLTRNP